VDALRRLLPAPLRAQSSEERVLWHCMVFTYLYYALGALYVVAPVVGWVLIIKLAKRRGLAEVPPSVWAWVVAMMVLLLALIMAHADYHMGLPPTAKSAVGWAKGWALIAIFIVIGCGQVRLELLARAACWLGVQTLLLLPIFLLAWVVGLPERLYVSPISLVGGPGPEFFAVYLYGISPDSGTPRWSFFAPWAPAIGMVMCVYLSIGLNEPNRWLRWLGCSGMVVAIVLSGSRLGLLAAPGVLIVAWMLSNAQRPVVYLTLAPLALFAALVVNPVLDIYDQAMSRFHGARADSSRVRAALGRIALQRWQADAPIWGHGNVEAGPHLVEHMPIGSHHTWFGLLFVKGLVGAVALATVLLWALGSLLLSGLRTPATVTAMRILLVMFLYTFAENLEILAYLYWPGLVALGIGLRQASQGARERKAARLTTSAASPPVTGPRPYAAATITPAYNAGPVNNPQRRRVRAGTAPVGW
jgi:hypothetical protein